MNIALSIDEGSKSQEDLDLESEDRFRNTVRNLCGRNRERVAPSGGGGDMPRAAGHEPSGCGVPLLQSRYDDVTLSGLMMFVTP
jgi:hypothetical protein